MITIPLLIIAALYIALMVKVSRKFQSWPARIAVVLVMLSPVIYWVGSYQYVHYRHEQDCAREGGLKVFIQPEKADRIRLDAESIPFGDAAADWLLRHHFPNLIAIEAWDGKYNSLGKKTGYLLYTPDPVTTSLQPKKWQINKTPLPALIDGLYVITGSNQLRNNIDKTTWLL